MHSKTPERILDYIDKCVRCGSCKAKCPTYGLRPIEPMSARGRVVLVGALIEGRVKPTRLMISRLSSCLLCGICEGSCPVSVGITEVVYHGLSLVAAHDRDRALIRGIMRFALRHPLMSFKAARLLRGALPMLRRAGIVPFDIKLPRVPLSVGLEVFKPQKPIGRVAVFTGCSVNYMHPQMGRALLRTLYQMGYETVLPSQEVCCGAPMRGLGLTDEAEQMARTNMEAFGHLNVEAVLSLCPTCTLTIKKHYPLLIGQGLDKAIDAMEFIESRLPASGITGLHGLKGLRLAYHSPCHLAHGLGVKSVPAEALNALGLDVHVPKEHNCCGFNQNMADRSLASDLAGDRRLAYEGYDGVVTACPGCVEQLRRSHHNVIHAIEALAVPDESAG